MRSRNGPATRPARAAHAPPRRIWHAKRYRCSWRCGPYPSRASDYWIIDLPKSILCISMRETPMPTGTIEKTSKLAKWGNSLGVRIPQEGVDRLKLKEGESVQVRVKGEAII